MKGDLKIKEILKVNPNQDLEIDLKIEEKENTEIKKLFHI